MRYFISDLDHTLLNEQAQLSAATIAILTAQPVPLMLCSARLPVQMDAFIQQLKLTGPQVALNGAVVLKALVIIDKLKQSDQLLLRLINKSLN